MMWLADEPKGELLKSAWSLWIVTAAVGTLFVVLLAGALAARRARRRGSAGKGRRRRGRPIPDAWAEAGRRVMPIRMDEPPPEVIDEPPDGEPEDRA